MDVKEFAIANLGKEVIWEKYSMYPYPNGMIVGYCEKTKAIITSFPDTQGWNEVDEDEDTILLHSPLNISYLYVFMDNYQKYWRIKE